MLDVVQRRRVFQRRGVAEFFAQIRGADDAAHHFCVLKKGANSDLSLAAELKKNVGRDLGKALAPRDVLFVADIPKTRNAKVMRRVVRAAYLGEKLGDTSALENPTSLDEIKRAAAAQRA